MKSKIKTTGKQGAKTSANGKSEMESTSQKLCTCATAHAQVVAKIKIKNKSKRSGTGLYLAEWQDHGAAAVLTAGEADVAVRGKHPAGCVAAAEGRPEGTVLHGAQLLLPGQPEEGPEKLVLRTRLQVPGQSRRGREGAETEGTRGKPRSSGAPGTAQG